MENLSVTWETALAIFGGVAVIAGGVKVIANLFSPYKKLKAQAARWASGCSRRAARVRT